MSKRARDELVSGIALRYAKAGRKEKGTILDEAVEDTGYNRKYLIHKLNMKASSAVRRDIGGRKHKVAYRRRQPGPEGHRGRPRKYDEALRASLVSIWYMFDMMCSKRLMKLIRDNITSIAAYPPFRITPGMGKKLLEMSPATADRLLRPEREKMRLRGKGGTRSPGSSLNALIPVRAYYPFEEREDAGSFEIDTVVHCGYGPQAVRFLEREDDVFRMAERAVFQLFGNHLVAFEQGHGRTVVLFIYEDVYAGDGADQSAQDVRRVLVVEHRGNTFVFQCSLYDMCLESIVASRQSYGSH